MSDELNTKILIDIREELRANREELRTTRDELREEIRGTNKRLDFVSEQNIRQATAMVALESRLGNAIEGLQTDVRGLNAEVRGLNGRLDNVFIGGMGKTVREHESRLQRVEQHLGFGPLEK
jgi:hypothetical protein